MKDLAKLRRRVRDAGKSGKTLPRNLRVEVANKAIATHEEEGLSYKQFATDVGVTSTTLGNWLELARADKGSASPTRKRRSAKNKVLPVSVDVAPSRASSLSVRLTSGLIIEGLSISDVAALHKALT